jgi:BirA family biotin operon repressor/biotin-[acetyl-CoA-carboxylase] ligase
MPARYDFDPRTFQGHLATSLVGRFLVYRVVVGSTMDIARREAAEGAPHGTLVLAEEQTSGRGRKGRSFFSPRGENIYATFVLRLDVEQHRRLPMAVPLAVCRACEVFCPDARIKWPNDIWIGGEKASGMLIDAEFAGSEVIAYPGIGINVNGDPTVNPELRGIATSLRRASGRPVPREELLARLCNELETWLEAPTQSLAREYRARNLLLGREILVHPPSGEPYPARATDVDADGALVVELADGRREALRAAEVTVRPS